MPGSLTRLTWLKQVAKEMQPYELMVTFHGFLFCSGVGTAHTILNQSDIGADQKTRFSHLFHGPVCSADGNPASKLNTAFIDQTSKTLGSSLFGAAEAILMRCHPGHFTIGDHTAGHGFKKEFSQSHRGIEDDCTLIVWWIACMNFLPFFTLTLLIGEWLMLFPGKNCQSTNRL